MTISKPRRRSYDLSTLYGPFLWGRHFVVDLRDRILSDQANDAQLDFRGVTMVSRAYADEFLKVAQFFKAKGVPIESSNLTPEVTAMFQFVKHKTGAVQKERSA